MNEDHLNMEIRRFLKKVGITSQRIIENEVYTALKKGLIKTGDEVELEMNLKIQNFNSENTVKSKIVIE
tara:strand:+ start:664 stop:870 length:207 start_codon:yes stop_codon:yes gene_type:complete